MATSLRTPPVGRVPPKTWPTNPEEHRRLLAESAQDSFSRINELEKQVAGSVAAAYGGMRFRVAGTTPVAGSLGTTPTKITLYDESLPLFGPSLYVSFDQPNSEVIIESGQGGVYEASLYLNFEGEQGELYTFDVRLDGATIGNPVYERVSQADNTATLQLTTIGLLSGGGRWSVWANADKAATTFNVYGTGLYFTRVSPKSSETPAVLSGLF